MYYSMVSNSLLRRLFFVYFNSDAKAVQLALFRAPCTENRQQQQNKTKNKQNKTNTKKSTCFGFQPHTVACPSRRGMNTKEDNRCVGSNFSQWPLIVRVTDESNEADWWLIGTMNINETRMLNAQYDGRVH